MLACCNDDDDDDDGVAKGLRTVGVDGTKACVVAVDKRRTAETRRSDLMLVKTVILDEQWIRGRKLSV